MTLFDDLCAMIFKRPSKPSKDEAKEPPTTQKSTPSVPNTASKNENNDNSEIKNEIDQVIKADRGGVAIGRDAVNCTIQTITVEKFSPELLELLNQKKGMHVPYPRNVNFTGRDTLLTDLRAALKSGDKVALTHFRALTGLGGIGKTQLALEYSYRYQDDYDIVWWLRSESTSTLLDDFALMASSLKLPGVIVTI